MIEELTRPEIKAFKAADVDEAVAKEAADAIVTRLKFCSEDLTVKIVRFLPTTKSYLSNDNIFEILANVIVEVGSDSKQFGFVPSRVLEAIISVKEDDDTQKFLKAWILHD